MSQAENKATLDIICKALRKHCRITVENKSDRGEDALAIAVAELRRIEEKFCKYQNNSLIAKINRRAGLNHPTPLDEEAKSLIRFVDAMHKKSNGYFDPTTDSLNIHYGQKKSKKHTKISIPNSLLLVGWKNLTIDNNGAKLNSIGSCIALNSCIAAYALDCIRRKLINLGIEHALIEIGSNASTIGKQPDGSNWLVGLRHSIGAGGRINRIKLNGQSLAVCGKIERSISIGKEQFSGATNPRSGTLIPGILVCAVEAPNAIEAYSAAKICWVQPEKEGLNWLKSLKLAYFVIDRSLACHGELNAN